MKKSVPIQKGKLDCKSPPTRKMQMRDDITREDIEERVLRRSGQTCHLMTPKQ